MHAPLVMLALVLLVTGLALGALLVLLAARMILHPPRMNDGKAVYLLHRLSPGDLGLEFVTQNFQVRDAHTGKSLQIAGWWIPAPHPSDRTVILLHGFADAKVGAIGWSPPFHSSNWNILAIDLRAHGESGGSFFSGGYWERDDLNQVLDQLRAARPRQTRQLVLFGPSVGAAVAAATAVLRQDIAGVILESPFTDYPRAIAAQGRLMGLPGGIFARAATGLAQILSASRFDQVRQIDTILQVHSPLLLILSEHDELLEPSDVQQFRVALQKRASLNRFTQFYTSPQASHLMGMAINPAEYTSQIVRFLDMLENARPVQQSTPPLPSGAS